MLSPLHNFSPVDRVSPRMHLPNTGPEGTEYASESERDKDVVEDATLQAPDGALGVRRCFPLPKCPIVEAECFGKDCATCERSKSSADGLLNDEGAV